MLARQNHGMNLDTEAYIRLLYHVYDVKFAEFLFLTTDTSAMIKMFNLT